MHVISRKKLREFWQQHADAHDVLDNWYKIATKAQWSNLAEVQEIYPTAEAVSNFTVFNIKGNRYRLIVDIVYSETRSHSR
jgi:mRNA interferase HigB